MASKYRYVVQARKWFHKPGVFEIAPDAQVDYEFKENAEGKQIEIGAFVHARIWLLEDDAEPG